MKVLSQNMYLFLLRSTWHYAGEARPRLVLFHVLCVCANILISLQPLVLAKIINMVQAGTVAAETIISWAAVYGGVTMGFWLLHGPARVIERRVGYTVYRNFVSALYKMITSMPLKWHQDHHSGDTINRVNKAGRGLFNFTQEEFVIIQMIVRFSMSMILLSFYSFWLTVVSLAISLVIGGLIRRFDGVLVPLIEIGNEREHDLNASLFDYISNIVTILTLRLQKSTRDEVSNRINAMQPFFWREVTINEWKWCIVNILLVFTQAGIVAGYIAFHLWRHEALVIGTVVAIFQYLLMVSQVFYDGAQAYARLIQRHTDVKTVDGLIKDYARLSAAPEAGTPAAWRRIDIQNLSFAHHEGEDVLHHLRNVALSIDAGRKIALVGSSGAGKTTLLTLLRGLYETQEARLTIDGVVRNGLASLADFTTLVPQDSEIFENTVRYNLTLGTHVPDAVIAAALHVAAFDEVLPKLPQGIETDIRERGVNLSGGQKQRLALARGLIAARESSLLLLDEPTSSVDIATEAVIFDRLLAVCADKAIIASVHRLHLLPRFDHICLMRDGAIIEQGDFAHLLAQRGAFYQLWQTHLAQSTVGEKEER